MSDGRISTKRSSIWAARSSVSTIYREGFARHSKCMAIVHEAPCPSLILTISWGSFLLSTVIELSSSRSKWRRNLVRPALVTLIE
jgi:hypothetical protein